MAYWRTMTNEQEIRSGSVGDGRTPLADYFKCYSCHESLSLKCRPKGTDHIAGYLIQRFYFIHCVLFIILVSCAYMKFISVFFDLNELAFMFVFAILGHYVAYFRFGSRIVA